MTMRLKQGLKKVKTMELTTEKSHTIRFGVNEIEAYECNRTEVKLQVYFESQLQNYLE
jgi:hypothetical protein